MYLITSSSLSRLSSHWWWHSLFRLELNDACGDHRWTRIENVTTTTTIILMTLFLFAISSSSFFRRENLFQKFINSVCRVSIWNELRLQFYINDFSIYLPTLQYIITIYREKIFISFFVGALVNLIESKGFFCLQLQCCCCCCCKRRRHSPSLFLCGWL